MQNGVNYRKIYGSTLSESLKITLQFICWLRSDQKEEKPQKRHWKWRQSEPSHWEISNNAWKQNQQIHGITKKTKTWPDLRKVFITKGLTPPTYNKLTFSSPCSNNILGSQKTLESSKGLCTRNQRIIEQGTLHLTEGTLSRSSVRAFSCFKSQRKENRDNKDNAESVLRECTRVCKAHKKIIYI